MAFSDIDAKSFDDVIDYMNKHQKVSLFLYAWNIIKMKDTSDVMMTALNNECFKLKVTNNNGKSEEHMYTFRKRLINFNEGILELKQLHETASIVIFPSIPETITILMIWIIAFLGAATKENLNNIYILEYAKDLALYIVRSENIAAYILIALIVSHTIEGIYASFILSYNVKLSKVSINSWFSMITIIGYPVTKYALKLNKVALECNKNKVKVKNT